MGSTSDIRNGSVIKYNNALCTVLDHEHRTPGKGQACHQVKMRNMKTGKQLEVRFRSNENVDFVRVERNPYQFLYDEGDALVFMDMNSYEQIPVQKELIGEDSIDLMKENQDVEIVFAEGNIIGVEMPVTVVLRVTATEPGFKGDTATNVMKPATVETGAEIQVPLFINEGDLLKIDTRAKSYIERVKE